MKAVRVILVVFFSLFIFLEVFLMVSKGSIEQGMIKRILILCFLILMFTYNHKAFWFLGVSLFSYAMYYFFFRAVYASGSSDIEFTYSLNRILFGNHTGNRARTYINLFPFIFYLLALIVFLIKPTRLYYNIASTKSRF